MRADFAFLSYPLIPWSSFGSLRSVTEELERLGMRREYLQLGVKMNYIFGVPEVAHILQKADKGKESIWVPLLSDDDQRVLRGMGFTIEDGHTVRFPPDLACPLIQRICRRNAFLRRSLSLSEARLKANVDVFQFWCLTRLFLFWSKGKGDWIVRIEDVDSDFTFENKLHSPAPFLRRILSDDCMPPHWSFSFTPNDAAAFLCLPCR